MSLIVRPCRLDECPSVLDLWRRAEAIARPTDTLPDVERMVREHPGTLLVGEENGRLVGTVIAGWDGWRGGIYRLAVLPECRRRGVARTLVADAERRLAAGSAPPVGHGGPRRAAGGRVLGYRPGVGARAALAPLREEYVERALLGLACGRRRFRPESLSRLARLTLELQEQ